MTPRKHPHADMMRRWLDDDSLEVEMLIGREEWAIANDPIWRECQEYRFKPKMIKCGSMEFPEPMRAAPAISTAYWTPKLRGDTELVAQLTWDGSYFDKLALQRGLIHATQAAADAHARALIALTEVK